MPLLELLFFLLLLSISIPLLGNYMARVFTKEPTLLDPLIQPIERSCYRLCRIDQSSQSTWKEYGKDLLTFNLIGFTALLSIQLFQSYLPLNPENFPDVAFPLAFNTAASFTTNTNWQAYSGESSLSYFTQMLGLVPQNFLSAATGFAALLVLIRGLIRTETPYVGNFLVDLTRITLYLFIPLSILFSCFLILQGVPETLSKYVEIQTLESQKQHLPLGPIATQIAIKQLGSNGGGYFGTNSAHPYENPTPLTNFFEHFAILLIPAATVWSFGKITKQKKHATLIFFLMFFFWLLFLMISELGIQLDGSLEGVETRFGLFNTNFWSISTTATSNGSVNGMLSSLSPITSGLALLNMMLGEVVFGGVGVGLASMLMFVILTVFLSGLMVGRSPEYLGKKIEKNEMIFVVIAVLTPSFLILIGTALSFYISSATSSILNQGPHGFTEVLYAFTSAAANNGSAFSSLNANTHYFNYALAIVMILGRVSIILSSLAIGGFLAQKKTAPITVGTFSFDNLTFAILLFFVIIITGGLTFFPALSLGPIAEEILLLKGVRF